LSQPGRSFNFAAAGRRSGRRHAAFQSNKNNIGRALLSEALFNLVFDGRIADGFSQAQVRENLARLFSLDEGRLQILFSGKPVVLKKGLDRAQAIRFRNALARAGALGLIRSHAEPSPTPARPSPAPEPAPVQSGEADIVCPRCAHAQAPADACGACRMDLRLHRLRLAKRARLAAVWRR
jgi:hypothetical protein